MEDLEEGHVLETPLSAPKIHDDYHISETHSHKWANTPPPSPTPHNHTLVLTLPIPSYSDEAKRGRIWTDPTSNVDAETYTKDISNQVDDEDEIYCLDLSFIYIMPLQFVFPYSHVDFDGEKNPHGQENIPQGEPGDIQSDDDVPLNKNWKAKSSSDPSPSKKICQEYIVSKMEKIWGVSIDEAREFSR